MRDDEIPIAEGVSGSCPIHYYRTHPANGGIGSSYSQIPFSLNVENPHASHEGFLFNGGTERN